MPAFASKECLSGTVQRIARVVAMTCSVLGVQIACEASSSAALAQGFFSNLFGPPPSPPPQYLPPPRIQVAPVALPKPQISTPREPKTAPQSSGYKTMCVRLCDGFYWPISSSTSRGRFGHDADICSSSCESESKLFYLPANGDPAEMVDLQGRSYSKLPTAFKYRKAMDDSCRCKPRPWDKTELERHRRYAEAEAARNASKVPPTPPKETINTPADVPEVKSQKAGQSTGPATKETPSKTVEIKVVETEATPAPPAPVVEAKKPEPLKRRSPLQALIEEHRRQTRANVSVTYVKKPINGAANGPQRSQ